MMDESEIIGADINSEIMKGDEDIDWISKLPDCVLTNILSRLDPVELIETCVLSKRWCKLWSFVPSFRITFARFKRTSETIESDWERFENFVSSFLRLRDDATDLHHFSICHSVFDRNAKVSGSAAAAWVLYAAKHHPKKLDINLFGHDQIHWPDCLFICESLEDVCLNYKIKEDDRVEVKPDKVSLPNLTKLVLKYAFIDGDSMEKILLGCPALGNLRMNDCTLEMNSISFQTVKMLDMDRCNFVSEVIPSTYPISAPRLENLYFRARTDVGAKLQDMPMVTYARIHLFSTVSMDWDYNLELLSGLSSVENLEIGTIYMEEMLEAELPRCSTFFNLKILVLRGKCVCCYFHLLSSFLELCPNLEDLTLDHSGKNCENEHIEVEQDMGSFGCDRLRMIKIVYAAYDCTVNQLVGLLLKKTAKISRVKITLFKYN